MFVSSVFGDVVKVFINVYIQTKYSNENARHTVRACVCSFSFDIHIYILYDYFASFRLSHFARRLLFQSAPSFAQ